MKVKFKIKYVRNNIISFRIVSQNKTNRPGFPQFLSRIPFSYKNKKYFLDFKIIDCFEIRGGKIFLLGRQDINSINSTKKAYLLAFKDKKDIARFIAFFKKLSSIPLTHNASIFDIREEFDLFRVFKIIESRIVVNTFDFVDNNEYLTESVSNMLNRYKKPYERIKKEEIW